MLNWKGTVRKERLPSASSLPKYPEQLRMGKARNGESGIPSGFPAWVTRTQVLEASCPAGSCIGIRVACIGTDTGR